MSASYILKQIAERKESSHSSKYKFFVIEFSIKTMDYESTKGSGHDKNCDC